MRTFSKLLAIIVLSSAACYGDLTQEQKVADFLQLANLYAKNYAPYQWKLNVMGFDLYDGKPWLDKVKATTNDVDFWDVCVQYVAALQDSHDEFTIDSDYYSYLHFDVDIYDGNVLINGIDRSWLPAKTYPFQVGDQLISVDGQAVSALIKSFIPYAANGSANTSSRNRLAADAITFRAQTVMPKAYQVPAQSDIVVLRANGNTETYTIKWDQHGTPVTTAGILPSIRTTAMKATLRTPAGSATGPFGRYHRHMGDSGAASRADAWGVWQGARPAPVVETVAPYMQTLHDLQQMSAFAPTEDFNGFGPLFPVFGPPAGFKLRLGSHSGDQFLSGTFPLAGATIGFIRIPTMSPANTTTAVSQFTSEIAYFQANTDMLVIDVMRNGGGSLCYIETLVAQLTSGQYTASNYQIRATDFWLYAFDGSLQSAKANGAPSWAIALFGAYVADLQSALQSNRSMTGTMPICGPLATLTGSPNAYSKPIAVLVDEFTLSAAEAFSMMMQDSGRATIIGTRTDGGGGNPGSYNATTFSEGFTRVTRTFVVRGKTVQTPGFPPSQYMENTGVYPDVPADIMTAADLSSGGVPYLTLVEAQLTTMLPQKTGAVAKQGGQ